MNELPWPRSGDIVFTSGTDPHNRACINYVHKQDRQDLYARAYRVAAEELTKSAIEGRRPLDLLVYPIVFLWRHYIELRLKGVLAAARELLDYSPEKVGRHSLEPLWQKLRLILEILGPEGDQEPPDAVEYAITQLNAVDKGSTAFLYPLTLANKSSLPDGLRYVNVREFNEVMQRTANFLEGVDAMVGNFLEHKIEMMHADRF